MGLPRRSRASGEGGGGVVSALMKRSLSILAVACVAVAAPAWAHHSFNTFYDMTRHRSDRGRRQVVQAGQPHSEMIVEVTDAAARPWSAHHRENRCGQRENARGGRLKISSARK